MVASKHGSSVAAPELDHSSNPIADEIRETVEDRARHEKLDDVTRTLSDWSVATIVTGEYHGRFLIELLQNSRDALREARPDARDGTVRIRLTAEPTLVVANQGAALGPKVLLHSIGRFGQGTKIEGESIGHKGIGFKSVLEVSLTPEIYSCRRGDRFDLSVRFDPDKAAELVRARSPRWDDLVRESPAGREPGAAERIPVLQFPLWVDDPERRLGDVAALEGQRFDTVIRLPYDTRFDDALGSEGRSFSKREFVDRVQVAMKGVSDQMVLLLESFGTIVIEDEINGSREIITRRQVATTTIENGVDCLEVAIDRNGQEHSRWLVFAGHVPGMDGLEGDLRVAVRTVRDRTGFAIAAPSITKGDGGDAFHLFFPTQIATRVPLLLHAYFRVDAGRTRLASGKEARNDALLAGLQTLSVQAVRHMLDLGEDSIDTSSLPRLFVEADATIAKEPAAFREGLLEALDGLPWIPVIPPSEDRSSRASPKEVVVEQDETLAAELPIAIPPRHLFARTAMFYPAANIDSATRDFIASRAQTARDGIAGLTQDMLVRLLTPGEGDIWEPQPDAMDEGFRHLLLVLRVLRARSAGPAAVLSDVNVAKNLAFIPVLDTTPPFRQLRAPVVARDLERDEPWILARSEAARGSGLPAPPRGLGTDFLQDGVLKDDAAIRAAGYLGIRDYRVDSVLDALRGGPVPGAEAAEITRFIWRFLRRDEQSTYSVPRAADSIQANFIPGRGFWSRPDIGDLTGRQEIRRARALGQVLLPAANGKLRPADKLVFGADWASWAEEEARLDGSHSYSEMARSYASLAKMAPGRSSLVASPATISAFLEDTPSGDRDDSVSAVSPARLRHAFLVRLGVWEVPPVDSCNDRQARAERKYDPFADRPGRAEYLAQLTETGAEFTAQAHLRVHVGEDYAFRWPLSSRLAHASALAHGVALYRNCLRTHRYCTGCQARGHGSKSATWAIDTDADRMSMLAWELNHRPWVPVTLEGRPVEAVPPIDAWRDEEAPDVGHVLQSSARYLRLVDPSLPTELAVFVGIDDIAAASATRVGTTLRWLHDQMPVLLGGAPRPTSEPGRAYLSLHRRLYDRLARLERQQPGVSRAETADSGVLASRGDSLVFVDRSLARHDRGNFSTYRRLVGDEIPFLAVKAEQREIATALGVEEFVVKIEREGDDDGEDVTDAVHEFLHDRLAYIMAALSYYPVGGTTLEVGGKRFRERSRRVAAITVRHVADLRLRVHIDGKVEALMVGEGLPDEMYVQDPTGQAPIVFHDFHGPGWVESFRPAFASRLAEVLENEAYASVLRLLLTADGDDDARSLLREFGVGDDQVEEVARALEVGDRLARAAEQRWWDALLPMIGISRRFDVRETASRERLRSDLLTARPWSVPADLADRLMAEASSDSIRRTVGASSVLAALETGGVDLEALNDRLIARGHGEPGLDVRDGERRLETWRKTHGIEVVAVLAHKTYPRASERPDLWRVPSSETWHAYAPPSIFLSPVVADLEAAGLIVPDLDALAGADASSVIAGLVDLRPDELRAWWDTESDTNAENLKASQIAGWRRLLRPVLVAARTVGNPSGFEIREILSRVDEALGAPATIAALVASLTVALPVSTTLAGLLGEFIRAYRGFALPSLYEVAEVAVSGGVDPGLLERVRQVILGRRPSRTVSAGT
ncbi:MAG: hypothetical protein H0U52_07160 [Chloroflexi bacterium]|nr:hypothetical protein [Chloroflexota bacterium]